MELLYKCVMPFIALMFLSSCTYQYKQKDNLEPALIDTKGILIGEIGSNENYTMDVTGINGAVFSMRPVQLNEGRPKQMPFNPGPTKLHVFLTWPKTMMGKHVDIPFVAKPRGHYHLEWSKEGSENHAISLLDQNGKLVQKMTFKLVAHTEVRVIPIHVN